MAFVPTGIAGVVVATRFAGPLVTRLGVRTVLAGASLLSAGVVAGVSQLPSDGSYLRLLPWLIGIGATFTTAAVATTVAISSGVVPEHLAVSLAPTEPRRRIDVRPQRGLADPQRHLGCGWSDGSRDAAAARCRNQPRH